MRLHAAAMCGILFGFTLIASARSAAPRVNLLASRGRAEVLGIASDANGSVYLLHTGKEVYSGSCMLSVTGSHIRAGSSQLGDGRTGQVDLDVWLDGKPRYTVIVRDEKGGLLYGRGVESPAYIDPGLFARIVP